MREQLAKGFSLYAYIRGLNLEIENDIRQVLKKKELTFPGFRILWILYFDSNVKMRDLTTLTQTNISNVFRQLLKLEEEGLVVLKDVKNSRIKKISITEKGNRKVQEFIDENSSNSELQIVRLIEKIPEEELLRFLDFSSKLSKELIGASYSEFVSHTSLKILGKLSPTIK